MTAHLMLGDCVEMMQQFDAESVDAVVTDPPYGIRFMGKAWDGADIDRETQRRLDLQAENEAAGRAFGGREKPPGGSLASPAGSAGIYDFSAKGNRAFQVWTEAWAREAYRVLKPGGHLLSFSSTRTYHRMASGIEDAGFELRDTIAWLFGSGFPKSLDVQKALGVVHCPTGVACTGCRYCENARLEVERWKGWGTALKPAFEPIAVARKPLSGTVASTVREHGTGAMNIDATRIPGEKGDGNWSGRDVSGSGSFIANQDVDYGERGNMELGRWPANVVMDEEAGALLDGQTGELTSGGGPLRRGEDKFRNAYGSFGGMDEADVLYGDTGGASRFFYSAKTSRAERNAGLDDFETKPLNWSSGDQSPGTFQGEGTDRTSKNHHPTVKPIALMRWLCRLVTPPGGLILDPFLGSGTTGIAAALEGFEFAGSERDEEYMRIARARIAYWTEHGEDGLRICAERDAAERGRVERAEAGQLDLFETA